MPAAMKFEPALKDRYVTFAKKTTFHGFRELLDSTTICQRAVWGVVIALCTAMLAMFITKQTGQYVEGQIATKVSKLDQDISKSSPLVTMRLTNLSWIDVEKVKHLGITPEELTIAIGYLQWYVPYIFDMPPSEAKQRLKATMKKLNVSEIVQFYSVIARDSFDGDQSESMASGNGRVFGQLECQYTIDTSSKSKAPFGNTWLFQSQFNFTPFRKNIKDLYEYIGGNLTDGVIEMIRPVLMNIDTYMEVRLRPGYTYRLNTQSSIYRKLVDCTRDHPIDELYYAEQCRLDCELRANASLNTSSCISYTQWALKIEFTESYRKGHLTFCHLGYLNYTTGQIEEAEEPIYRDLTTSEIEKRKQELEACKKNCLPRCDQWVTTWSVASFEAEESFDAADFRIVFPDPKDLVVIEEYQQYEWYDLVSDLGGLLGLWLGASMMSLFQVFQLCFFKQPKRKVKDHGDSDGTCDKKVASTCVTPYKS